MVVATFGRKPFGSVSEVVFAFVRRNEFVHVCARDGDVRGIGVGLAVLEQRSVYVGVDKVVIKLQHAEFCVLVHKEPYLDG